MRIACKILRWNKTTSLREIESEAPPELKSAFYPASAFATSGNLQLGIRRLSLGVSCGMFW
jgi:hypothetical protein